MDIPYNREEKKWNGDRPLKSLSPWLLLIISLSIFDPSHAGEPEVIEVGRFSAAAAGATFPDGWKPVTFKKIERHTTYTLVREDGRVVVKAVSDGSSSGLAREIKIDPRSYPIVQWRWKVTNLLEKADVSRKDGDDYPARLYITFEYDAARVGLIDKAVFETARLLHGQYPPIGAITYIWESRASRGTIVPNAYTKRAQMVVVESGAAGLNTWITEERNLYEDYKRAFGEEPTTISGVAIMTDTDDTQESAITYYGDILFKKGR